jgi:hypothetical protein
MLSYQNNSIVCVELYISTSIILVTAVAVLIITNLHLQSCRLLEKMDLEECVLITDATLIHLAMGCPRLEKLVSHSGFVWYLVMCSA